MRKDLERADRSQRSPVSRRSQFSTPWFDDLFEPTRWFDDMFRRDLAPAAEGKFLSPAIDIDETDSEYIVIADLPGVKKEDISVECSGSQLTISAERKYESTEGRKSDRRERYYGSYQRSFTLPSECDPDKIEASFEGGVLNVHIPKGEQAKARRIQIGEGRSQAQSREQETSKH